MTNGTRKFFDEEFLARLEQLHLIAKRIVTRGAAGRKRSQRLGDGLEFADHRDYAPGDDVRFVDWPYFARMGKLLLRLFHEHSEADVVILLDTSGSMAPGGKMAKFDYARRAAAALAYVAMGSGQRAVLVPFGETLGRALRTGRNRRQMPEVLDFLADLAPGGRTRLGHCLERLVRRHESPGTALLVSDLMDCREELADGLVLLRPGGCELTVLHLQSPDEAEPVMEGAMLLQDAETARRISLPVTPDVLASYRRAWAEFVEACRHACLSRGVTYVAAPTSVPFERLVLETLRRVGVLE